MSPGLKDFITVLLLTDNLMYNTSDHGRCVPLTSIWRGTENISQSSMPGTSFHLIRQGVDERYRERSFSLSCFTVYPEKRVIVLVEPSDVHAVYLNPLVCLMILLSDLFLEMLLVFQRTLYTQNLQMVIVARRSNGFCPLKVSKRLPTDEY